MVAGERFLRAAAWQSLCGHILLHSPASRSGKLWVWEGRRTPRKGDGASWCQSKELRPSICCRFCPAVSLAAGQAQLALHCKLSGRDLAGALPGLHSRWEAGCGGRCLGDH